MFNKKILCYTFLLFCLISISMVSAVPPVTTTQQFAEGYIIQDAPQTHIIQNEDFIVNFFVYNSSNGLVITNSSIYCVYYLANSSGNVIYYQNITHYNVLGFWNLSLKGSNFSNSGIYNYGIKCLSIASDGFGGSLVGSYEISEDGIEITESRSILIIGLLAILVLLFFISLFALFQTEHYIGKLALYWASHTLFILISFTGWQIGVEGILKGMALTGIFRIIFWISTIAVFPMIILSIAWIIYIHTFNEHFQKLIDKGEDTETAFKMTKKKRGGWFNGK